MEPDECPWFPANEHNHPAAVPCPALERSRVRRAGSFHCAVYPDVPKRGSPLRQALHRIQAVEGLDLLEEGPIASVRARDQ